MSIIKTKQSWKGPFNKNKLQENIASISIPLRSALRDDLATDNKSEVDFSVIHDRGLVRLF